MDEAKKGIKTEYHLIDEEGVNFPIPLGTMPNHMGINLCSVEGMSWSRLPDGQLISVTVHFLPNLEDYPQVRCTLADTNSESV